MLPDGSSPPLLSTVLDSLIALSSRMTLYIELKSAESAAQLARALENNPTFLQKLNLIIISFSLNSLGILRRSFHSAPLHLLWLVDNPRIPYSPESLDDGELTFDICHQTFEEFLDANSLRELFLEVAPEGLGIQCAENQIVQFVLHQEITKYDQVQQCDESRRLALAAASARAAPVT
jgi:glycerophosphoryl diester phosphodiesterase